MSSGATGSAAISTTPADAAVALDAASIQWRLADDAELGHLLVLLHGVGSNEHDLIGLSPYLPEQVTLASLPAPRPWPNGGRSWFDLDPPNLAQLEDSVSAVLAWLDGVADDYESIGLLGFSQGAVMTFELVRRQPQLFSYLIALSGFAIGASDGVDPQLAQAGLPAFIGWGSHDLVIPAERTNLTLAWAEHQFAADIHQYPMGHTIIDQELRDLCAFLARHLS